MGVGRPYLLAIESPARRGAFGAGANARQVRSRSRLAHSDAKIYLAAADARQLAAALRSEEHTSELQSLMRNSYAVFCLKTKTMKRLLQRIIKTELQIIGLNYTY